MADNHVIHRHQSKPTIDNVTRILNTKNAHMHNNSTVTSPLTNGKCDYITDPATPTNGDAGDVIDTSSPTNEETELQRFYNGASVLVTGATGFMGKVLIEKLLRSCPGVRNIYLLVRRKKGKSVEERIDELTTSPCFHRLSEEFPKFRSKLYPVSGDLSSALLGISDSDKKLLADDVTVVFHVAATVRFDEQIKMAVEQNVKGTKELLGLCRTFTRLKSVVHVSTAYANCQIEDIEEKFYDPPLECDEAIQLAENFNSDLLNTITPKLLGKWPNTYAYTKAISENAVKKYSHGLPVGIFRPAVVICTNEEPMPGWIDNLYGPTGVIVGVASGLMRTLNVDGDIAANIVPCDMVINAMLATAWDVEQLWLASKATPLADNPPPPPTPEQQVPIYNYVSPAENSSCWNQYIGRYLHHGVHYPISRAIWYYTMVVSKNRSAYLLLRFFLHILPALVMDAGLFVTGHKPQMLRVYEKIHKFSDVIAYFGLRVWRFEDANVRRLWAKLEPRDRQVFPFDMRALSWDKFVAGSCPGLRRYIMQDPPSTLPQAKIRMQRLYLLHRATQLVFISLGVWLLWIVVNTVLPASSYFLPSGLV